MLYIAREMATRFYLILLIFHFNFTLLQTNRLSSDTVNEAELKANRVSRKTKAQKRAQGNATSPTGRKKEPKGIEGRA